MAKRKKSTSSGVPAKGASSAKVSPSSAPAGFGSFGLNAPGATKKATRYKGVKPVQRASSK